MRDELQAAMVARLREADPYVRWSYAPQSMRNPASHYVDPLWFADEQQALFRNQPQFAGLSVECAEPGSYLSRNCGGVPILIVRQQDGSLRAFVNACRHRAAPLLEGDGKGAQRIVCPYHAWTYASDGRLLGQPASDGAFKDVVEECDLIQRAVAEKHGLIFVHPASTEPFEVSKLLHGMEDEFGLYGIETAHLIETRETLWNLNWKLMLDTFLESYHVRFIHRKTIDPVFFSNQLFDTFGPFLRVIGLRRAIMEQMERSEEGDWRLFPNAAAVYVLLPNALITYQGDHIETWRFEPIDTFTTRACVSLFAPSVPESDKALRYWLRNLEVLCDVAFNEDFPVQEKIQANLRSGAVSDVIYGRLEPALVHYHRSVNNAVEAWRNVQGR